MKPDNELRSYRVHLRGQRELEALGELLNELHGADADLSALPDHPDKLAALAEKQACKLNLAAQRLQGAMYPERDQRHEDLRREVLHTGVLCLHLLKTWS